jgi:CII-binding regulator of phage lambda lysogenization HflD
VEEVTTINPLTIHKSNSAQLHEFVVSFYGECMNILDKLQGARASLNAQKEENDGLKKYIIQVKEERNTLISAFAHIYDNGSEADGCKQCGLDLDNPVHFI